MATMPLLCDRERWRTGKNFSRPARIRSPERIVYLWNLDDESRHGGSDLDALLHLTPGARIRSSRRRSFVSIWLRANAQPAGNDPQPTAVAQAPSIGLMRVILNEYSNLRWRAIDLSPEA